LNVIRAESLRSKGATDFSRSIWIQVETRLPWNQTN
jgi:hypothetical protein